MTSVDDRSAPNTPPKVSVITVVKNAVDTIEDTLLSVLGQSHNDLEHILVDGGSTDGTLEVIQRHYAANIRVLHEPGLGIYHAMNLGWKEARGSLISFLNADDYYHDRDTVRKAVEQWSGDLQEVVHGDLIVLAGDRRVKRRKPKLESDWIYRMEIFHPTMFVPKELFLALSGFDTSFRVISDWDFALRAKDAGTRFLYSEDIAVTFRLGGASGEMNLARALENLSLRKRYSILKGYFCLCMDLLRVSKRLVSNVVR